MTHPGIALAAVAALALATGCAALDHTHPAPPPPEPAAAPAATRHLKIAFVDVKRALEDYKKTEVENDRLKEMAQQYRDKVKSLVVLLEKQQRVLRRKLDGGVVPGKEKFERIKREILQLEQKIKFEKKWSNYAMGADFAKATLAVYEDLLSVVREVAAAEGYDVVFKVEDGIVNADEMMKVNIAINQRGVLFWKRSHDLTAEVIERLNADFK